MRAQFWLATATVMVLLGTPALAAPPPYVGTWGIDTAMCANQQDVMGAPVILGAKSFDQHESHCTFGQVKHLKGLKWRTKATCSIEGDKQVDTLVIGMVGGKLSLAWGGANPQLYQRCAGY
jgi:hypothetical protein